MDLTELGLVVAARGIAAGDFTSEELTRACLARTEAAGHLNAFISLDAEAALEAARKADEIRRKGKAAGALHGLPITFKDNIDVLPYPTTAGTTALRQHRPGKNSQVAGALIGAGAIPFGKNAMHELAFGVTNNNKEFGPTRNPYDLERIPGGSSGGTAVAVAARLAPAGIGTDTGGSVRVPSALCGLYGLRPTLKRWPQAGIVPIALTRDTPGPIARSIADLALLDSVVTGDATPLTAPEPRTLRLGVPRARYWEGLDQETAEICDGALTQLREAGVALVEKDIEDITALNDAVSFTIALHEPRDHITAYLRACGSSLTFEDVVAGASSPDVKPIMASMLEEATRIPHATYLEAKDHHRPRLIAAIRDHFSATGVDAIVFPTTPLPAAPIGDDETVAIGDARVPTFPTYIRNADPGSNSGIPGITIPVGVSRNGLPIGLALDGPAGSDRRLLGIADALARLFPPLPAPRLG